MVAPVMAGYSSTPLAKKLGIKPGALVYLLRAPAPLQAALSPLPEGVTLRHGLRARQPGDVILLFAKDARTLRRGFDAARQRMKEAAGLWICWPKKSSGVATDLDDGAVRAFGLGSGLVDNKVCAVDETWSGLRFVVRVADRKARG